MTNSNGRLQVESQDSTRPEGKAAAQEGAAAEKGIATAAKGIVTVADIEGLLLEAYPASVAEDWDNVGLLVGDPTARVRRVGFALNASIANVEQAADRSCDLLVTHHPMFLEAPSRVLEGQQASCPPSTCVWRAVRRGVSVISMHTNLDRHGDATAHLPNALGYEVEAAHLESLASHPGFGLGSTALLEPGCTTASLVDRCIRALGRPAQVYGSASARVTRAAFFTGSLGDCGALAIAAHADVVVCGECGYHRALDLLDAGCQVVVLGHDVSELGLAGVLKARVTGRVPDDVECVMLDEGKSWF